MNIQSPLTELKGVGDKVSTRLARLQLKTIDDLINYYPRRYEDYSQITTINHLRPGPCSIEIELTSFAGRYVKRGMHVTEAVARDKTGSVRLVWFNQPYRLNFLKPKTKYYVSGTYELRYQRFSLINPTIELVSDFPINTARIIPKYPETKDLSSLELRKLIKQVSPIINGLPDNLPPQIVASYKLIPHARALSLIHFPASQADLVLAKKRLGFEEVFCLVLASQLNKQQLKKEKSINVDFDQALAKAFVKKLSFQLTDDQRRAIWQIYLDMSAKQPMNRLVEGDVGSGKTVVAVMAGLMVLHAYKQIAFMAPTELLATQHAETVYNLLKPLGLADSVCLLIGGLNAKQKVVASKSIASGKAKFIVGTHALIQEHIDMHDLALIIIDEQHRFGVKQRQALKLKAKSQPHVLSLSATPIPRSLALILFGELDISRLIDKPSHLNPVKTLVYSESEYARQSESIRAKLDLGQQMFIVCPSIEDTDPGSKHSVNKTFERITKEYIGYKVGLVHGKLSSLEKSAAMSDFVGHKYDILVATTVIEVGIDIPNATIMTILSSDNFGLAQLHQLRGRVGRGQIAGICYLVHDDNTVVGPRLKALESSNDGFELAELDLRLRGPGAIYGLSQHGILDLRLAELSDTTLINQARSAAKYFVDNGLDLIQYSQLQNKVSKLQKLTNLN